MHVYGTKRAEKTGREDNNRRRGSRGDCSGEKEESGEGGLDERAIVATIPLYANQKYANKG